MLLVKTKLGPSKIHGIGLFAEEFIAKDTPVWQFANNFDIQIAQTQLNNLLPATKDAILKYAFLDKNSGNYILCPDDARFFNHSDEANVQAPEGLDQPDIAVRDIMAGEELTENYKIFDADY